VRRNASFLASAAGIVLAFWAVLVILGAAQ